jgi:hypothetical protein
MFSKKERKEIEKAIEQWYSKSKLPKKTLLLAASGMQPKIKDAEKANVYLTEALEDKKDPIIHDDSTSAWMHVATLKYGLRTRDIRKMKFGDTKKILFMDRNVGEYVNAEQKSFNPKKQGFSYGIYIHGEGLTGLLSFYEEGVIHAPFTWEINLGALGFDSYWGPIGCDDCKSGSLKEKDVKDDILVGWRGPAIDFVHLDDLPKKITLYDTWWDDYGVSKYHDWLHFS